MSIKVLWVEDDPTVKDGLITEAMSKGITLRHFFNWEEAHAELKYHFSEYDALVLDALCLVNKSDTSPSDDFLQEAWGDLNALFTKNHCVRPWYVLSEGTMSRFDHIIKRMEKRRSDFMEEWGDLLYYKSKINPDDKKDTDEIDFDSYDSELSRKGVGDLWAQIIKTCTTPQYWPVMMRHRDTFEYLGEGKLISGKARGLLMDLLSALYEPQKYDSFKFHGNPIRRIFECVVHSAVELGIICQEVREDGNVKCKDASRFLSGTNPERLPYRFGFENERLFNSTETSILTAILASTNVASHESIDDNEEQDVILNEDNRDEFTGCALLLCKLIKAFGKYACLNSDKQANIAKWMLNPKIEEGKIKPLRVIGTTWYADNCLLPRRSWFEEGKNVILNDIVLNKSNTSDTFPFFCKNPQTPKSTRQ